MSVKLSVFVFNVVSGSLSVFSCRKFGRVFNLVRCAADRILAVRLVIFLLALFPVMSVACAQESLTSFREGLARMPAWQRPFWADMHSTLIRGEMAMALNSPEYDFGKNGGVYRPYVFSNLGADLPVWSGDFLGKNMSIAVTLPFMIDVWMDFFERSTAPVINTSYRFGGPEFSFIHRLSRRNVKNYVIKFTPLKHECTHIGDELTIFRKNAGLPLTRINVSYNYMELVFTVNDPECSLTSNHGFRAGFMLLLDFNNGWYNIMEEEGDRSKVVPSKSPYEFYFQYQYQSNTSRRGLQGIFSFEVRNRVKYGYPSYYTDKDENWIENKIPEYRNFTFNAFVGIRYNNPKGGYLSRIGLGIRGYHGINPYGQFRSQSVYNQLGIALIFE